MFSLMLSLISFFAKADQYFLWYLIFLPFYLPTSSLLRSPTKGITALVLWVVGQVCNTGTLDLQTDITDAL